MKKKILSQLMILSFAFAGLFLVGNNVFAEQEHSDHLIPPAITCSQFSGPGATCWFHHRVMSLVFAQQCFWSGNQADVCNY